MLKTHVCLLNCHNFALNPDHSLLDSKVAPRGICKLCGHVRAVCHIHFFWFPCYFADVCLSSGPLSSPLPWLPQRRGFPPVVCNLSLHPAPLQQVICPSRCLTAGAGQTCPTHHPFPFNWGGMGKWVWRFRVIHPPPRFSDSWLRMGWGEQEHDRTPCILPWHISEPMPYGVLSRGYVPIPGN